MANGAPSAKSVEAPPSALSIFHEDILLSILSYVADAPFEIATAATGEFGSIVWSLLRIRDAK